MGPQASTLQIVAKPGAQASGNGAPGAEPPLGWEE
jgi:hypothetical protein